MAHIENDLIRESIDKLIEKADTQVALKETENKKNDSLLAVKLKNKEIAKQLVQLKIEKESIQQTMSVAELIYYDYIENYELTKKTTKQLGNKTKITKEEYDWMHNQYQRILENKKIQDWFILSTLHDEQIKDLEMQFTFNREAMNNLQREIDSLSMDHSIKNKSQNKR
ncbi:MAG: hypothetical protein ACXAD7_02000 [Candidatus Kariarchaeaceae archaeon]